MDRDTPSNQCKRCGRCMSVCPVFQTTFQEADVARGRLAILEEMLEGGHSGSPRLSDILSRCLMCGACADACVNKVDTTRWIQKGRQTLVDGRARRSLDRVLVKRFREGGIGVRVLSKGGALLEALLCQKIPESSGLHLRFPLSFFTKRSVVPSLAWSPFLKEKAYEDKKPGRKRVAFFVGCGANYLFPEAARALMGIMDRLGVTVVVPPNQGCCGLPAYVAGDTETAMALAEKNLRAFAGVEVDAVVTVCASCGAHLEHMGRHFKDHPALGNTAQRWVHDHRDAMTFLVEDLGLDAYMRRLFSDLGKGEVKRVAYHDPCHLRIAQEQTADPRRLLSSLPGVNLQASAHEGNCCGHGGDFNLAHFDLSMKILDRRMGDFQKVHPQIITTGCTGCLLQFLEGVGRHELNDTVRVCHPLVLVAEALKV